MGKQALQCDRASRHRLPQRVQKKKPKEKKDPSIMRRYIHNPLRIQVENFRQFPLNITLSS